MKVGTAIKSTLAAAGVRPCGGCQKRAEWLDRVFDGPIYSCTVNNQTVTITPRDGHYLVNTPYVSIEYSTKAEALASWESFCQSSL